MAPSTNWKERMVHIPLVSEAANALITAVIGRSLKFSFKDGQVLMVREERLLPHCDGTRQRARCLDDPAREFDVRRLTVTPEAGGRSGFVSLASLQALEREVAVLEAVSPHPNVVRCHASLVENVGLAHARLLLCEPCVYSLEGHFVVWRGIVSASDVAAAARDVAVGIRHLNAHQIHYGRVVPTGVFLGYDDVWKLGQFTSTSRVPLTAAQWHRQHASQHESSQCVGVPPELRGCGDIPVLPAADVWFLGYMLATLLLRICGDSTLLEQRSGAKDTLVVVAPEALLHPLQARLWLLIHCMLAAEPSHRMSIDTVVELLDDLGRASPEDLLAMMPTSARFNCSCLANAAARKLAARHLADSSALGEDRAAVRRLTSGTSLAKLRSLLQDPSDVDIICDNCGINSEHGQVCVNKWLHGTFPHDPDSRILEYQPTVPLLVTVERDGLCDCADVCDAKKERACSVGDLFTDAGSMSDSESCNSGCPRKLSSDSGDNEKYGIHEAPPQLLNVGDFVDEHEFTHESQANKKDN